MMHIHGCAMVNGLPWDTGPCDIVGIPVGLFVVALAVLTGLAIARRLNRLL